MPSLHQTPAYDDASYHACCSDCGHLASSAEYDAWLDALDAAPRTEDGPFDDGPLFEPSQEDLEWLLSQRDDCRALPETLAALDAEIGGLRRALAAEPLAARVARYGDEDRGRPEENPRKNHRTA